MNHVFGIKENIPEKKIYRTGKKPGNYCIWYIDLMPPSTFALTDIPRNNWLTSFRKTPGFSSNKWRAIYNPNRNVTAGELQKDGECKEMFIALLNELQKIAQVLNIEVNTDLVYENLGVLAGLATDTTASMQKDMKAGKNREKDELIFERQFI